MEFCERDYTRMSITPLALSGELDGGSTRINPFSLSLGAAAAPPFCSSAERESSERLQASRVRLCIYP